MSSFLLKEIKKLHKFLTRLELICAIGEKNRKGSIICTLYSLPLIDLITVGGQNIIAAASSSLKILND